MRSPAEEFARENCVKGGRARVSSNGQECKHCGFDADELQRRKALPLTKNEAGLLHKDIGK